MKSQTLDVASTDFTGPRSGDVVLGCASFSLTETQDRAAAILTIRAARAAGISLFDSARAYAPFGDPLHNERLLRQALGSGSLVATKGGHYRDGPHSWAIDNTRGRLRKDVEDSLRALEVDELSLYYLHRADSGAPVADAVIALDELRLTGSIGAIGLSNVTVEQINQALEIAPISAVQNPFSVTGRESLDVLQRCEELDIPFYAYSPFGGAGGAHTLTTRLPRLTERAAARNVSIHRLALRALLATSPVMSVVAAASRVRTARDIAAAPGEPWNTEDAVAYAQDLDQIKEQPS